MLEETLRRPEGAVRGLIRRLLDDERVRFIIVGGFNTVLGYGLFAVLDLAFGHTIGYLGSLYCSYALATTVAFVLHRRFTFRASKTGRLVVDYARFQIVYVITLVLNTIALPLLVKGTRLNPLLAQAMIVVVATIISYVGHKWFSFRRAKPTADESPHDAASTDGDIASLGDGDLVD